MANVNRPIESRPLNMKKCAMVLFLLMTACLEAQPAPDLQSRPSTDFNVEIIADGLNTPWGVSPMPGGGYLVTEKQGVIKRILPNGKIGRVTGGPADIYTEQQAGLFDVLIAADYTDNLIIYFAYAYGDAGANGTALYRAELPRPGTHDGADGLTLTGGQDIFRSDAKDTASHFGGRIVEMPDKTFILTLGDGFAYREAAQDKTSHLGKIIRLNRDGSAANGNPFADQNNIKPEIYSLGHRNVQGAHYDATTQTLWAHEHGPRGGDELNIITPGQNYGWPTATTGRDYNGAKISPFDSYAGMQAPIHDWVPSIAPSGLVIYRGDMFPSWNGDALVGGLAAKSLRRVDIENGLVVGEVILLADLNARVRDVRMDKDGAVLLLTNTKKDMEPGGLR